MKNWDSIFRGRGSFAIGADRAIEQALEPAKLVVVVLDAVNGNVNVQVHVGAGVEHFARAVDDAAGERAVGRDAHVQRLGVFVKHFDDFRQVFAEERLAARRGEKDHRVHRLADLFDFVNRQFAGVAFVRTEKTMTAASIAVFGDEQDEIEGRCALFRDDTLAELHIVEFAHGCP